jgi:putative membrane protein
VPAVALHKVRLAPSPAARLANLLHWLVFAAFLASCLWVGLSLWPQHEPLDHADWRQGILLLLAAATTLLALARQLPGQNVLLVAVIILLFSGGAIAIGAATGIPFGSFRYSPRVGPCLFEPLPWSIPILWLVILLNARGVARLILRPWRDTPTYGLRMLGLTVALALILDFQLELYATRVAQLWFWTPTRVPLDLCGIPLTHFLGFTVSSLLILFFVTHALINKKPAPFPPDYHPLAVWLLLTTLLAIPPLRHGHPLPTAAAALLAIAAAVIALQNSRQPPPRSSPNPPNFITS